VTEEMNGKVVAPRLMGSDISSFEDSGVSCDNKSLLSVSLKRRMLLVVLVSLRVRM
jgi:hypothetical protein